MRFHVDARFVPGRDPAPELAAEVARVSELRADGFIELVLRRTDDTGAYLVVEAESAAAVDEALATLPFARSGTMTFAVHAVETL
ncbi:hypothetical protein ACQP04_25785 [Pseudonocardia halophobica]|uniref:hypothetical protein n=1 Tax=Pseudonocardia halophobica TaxID=29401 RepID=UPI003D8D382D